MLSLPIKITLNTARDFDPTRTIVLRGQFIAQVNKRFRDLKGATIRLLTKDNFLEPVEPTKYQPGIIPIALAVKYEYLRSDIKVEQFMGWLQDQEKQGILQIFQRPGGLRRGQSQAWTDTYIQSSYQKGMVQARADLRRAGADIPSFQRIPGGVPAVFNQPFHADRVALIYTRCFNGMQGVTGAMNGHLSRELALGMAEGQSPYTIARRINEKVDKIGIVRGRLIARTEIVQSHNEAALNEYKRAEIEIGEPVLAEWIAVMDSRTRAHHAERNGNVYELSEAREMLGEPNCRCGLAPWVKSLQKKVPVEKIAWKPAMTKAKADIWAKNSVMKGTLFHGTSKSAKRSIVGDGFKLKTEEVGGKIMGDGVYFTPKKSVANGYAKQAGIKHETLNVRVNVKKIYKLEPGDIFIEDLDPENIPTFLKAKGYQGIDATGYADSLGISIFDPKDIVVIIE